MLKKFIVLSLGLIVAGLITIPTVITTLDFAVAVAEKSKAEQNIERRIKSLEEKETPNSQNIPYLADDSSMPSCCE